MHDGLVRLVFEVAVPARTELLARPRVHLVEFFLCRPDLDTSFDTISRQRSCAISVPLVEDRLLDLRISPDEIVKTFNVRLGTEDGKRKVVILEVETNTREVDERLDAGLTELLGVADTRSLENEWRGQSATRDNDLFAGPDDLGCQLSWRKRLGGNSFDANSAVALENDLY